MNSARRQRMDANGNDEGRQLASRNERGQSNVQRRAGDSPAQFLDNRPAAAQLHKAQQAAQHGSAMTAQRMQFGAMKEADADQRERFSEPAANSSKARVVPSHLGIAQRVPVGTGHGTDDDRNAIRVENLAGNEQINVRGDNRGRAQIISDFIVDNHNYRNQVLKHYMVVKRGSLYQFPIKHVFAPRRDAIHNNFRPNAPGVWRHPAVPTAGNRGGQPDAFGGNTDLAQDTQLDNQNLTGLRNQTLAREYGEENHAHNNATLNVTRAKKFGSAFGAGTLSIAETDQVLAAGNNAHALNNTPTWGEAEMAGTVTIDCDALITGILVGDDLEAAIGQRLQTARDQFYADHAGHDPGDDRVQTNIFASNAGILAHLIGMVKDDLIAERQRRQQQALLALQAQQERERQELALRQQREREDEDRARREREALQERQKQALIAFVVKFGLVVLLAYLIKFFFFS